MGDRAKELAFQITHSANDRGLWILRAALAAERAEALEEVAEYLQKMAGAENIHYAPTWLAAREGVRRMAAAARAQQPCSKCGGRGIVYSRGPAAIGNGMPCDCEAAREEKKE